MYSSDFEVAPKTLEEIYSAYTSVESSVIVAGAWGLKQADQHYDLAIKLDNAGLDYIRDTGDELVIGAMTTLQTIENSTYFKDLSAGILSSCIREIKNKELKNAATIGGVLAYKNSFSVLIPILLSMHVDVELQEKGRMSLRDYLPCPPMHELITRISIAKEPMFTSYAALRKTPDDSPYLTGAVTMCEESLRIVIGGRPGIAAIAENAREVLRTKGMAAKENVAHIASEELDFADDDNCSEQERRKLAIDMVRDLIGRSWKGFSRMAGK